MKHAIWLALVVLAAASDAGIAEPLNAKSKTPDWGRASQAEKDTWIAAFQFKTADADREGVAQCLDEHAGRQLFADRALSGVTDMCATIAALPE
jgi:hypothetical protein